MEKRVFIILYFCSDLPDTQMSKRSSVLISKKLSPLIGGLIATILPAYDKAPGNPVLWSDFNQSNQGVIVVSKKQPIDHTVPKIISSWSLPHATEMPAVHI